MENENVPVQRWCCYCAYDGTEYAGWQKQPTGDAVQDRIEDALEKICHIPVRTIGAGRTDAGVHAREQVFHFDHNWIHGADKLLQALRSHLPSDISPRSLVETDHSFHALRSAQGKCYRYRAVKGWAMPEEERFCLSLRRQEYDLQSMTEAAKFLVGRHNFSAFAASRGKGEKENPVKDVWRCELIKNENEIQFFVEGSGFLYKMVRGMVGGLLEVGRGKIKAKEIRDILRSCQRTEMVVSAPAKGLCLDKVYYTNPVGQSE